MTVTLSNVDVTFSVLSYSGSSQYSMLCCQKIFYLDFLSSNHGKITSGFKMAEKKELAPKTLLTSKQDFVCKCLTLALELCRWILDFWCCKFSLLYLHKLSKQEFTKFHIASLLSRHERCGAHASFYSVILKSEYLFEFLHEKTPN